jgi:hypothetical protein
MLQRTITKAWSEPSKTGSRLRLLVESSDPLLGISDFTQWTDAGFDVALCSGPAATASECPLVRGEPCELAAGADAILFALPPSRVDVLQAVRRSHAATPVVVQLPGSRWPEKYPIPEGTEIVWSSCSVPGQIRVLRRAAVEGRRRRGAQPDDRAVG